MTYEPMDLTKEFALEDTAKKPDVGLDWSIADRDGRLFAGVIRSFAKPVRLVWLHPNARHALNSVMRFNSIMLLQAYVDLIEEITGERCIVVQVPQTASDEAERHIARIAGERVDRVVAQRKAERSKQSSYEKLVNAALKVVK